jgi:TonB family protein
MASSAQNSQAKIAEIPVTVQGARAVEGEGRRELFTEITKTTLVFDKGAVVALKSKVTNGQCVFVRNEQTGREIMCRVIESRQTGEVNYADLEFTSYGPDFWDPPEKLSGARKPFAEQSTASPAQPFATPSAPAQPPARSADASNMPASIFESKPFDTKLDAQQKIARAVEGLMSPNEPPPTANESATAASDAVAAAAPPAAEENAIPPHQQAARMIADAPPDELAAIAASAGDVSSKELEKRSDGSEEEEHAESQAAAPQPAAGDGHAARVPEAEPDSERDADTQKDSAQLAALIAIDERKRAKREAAAKSKAETGAPSPDSPQSAEALVDQQTGGPKPDASASSIVSRAVWALKFGGPKIRIGVGLVAMLLVIASVGLTWRAKHAGARSAHGSNLPSTAWMGTKQPAAAANATASNPSQPAGASAAGSGAPSKSNGAKTAGVSVAPPSRLADVKVAGAKKSAAAESAAVGDASRIGMDHSGAASRKRPVASGSAEGEITPPEIVSGPQPTFPSWAESVDEDPVVLLEATIDENGKLTHTRVLSGPRALQREAQKAVELWMFDPAKKPDGTPVATHMVLTVEFQR